MQDSPGVDWPEGPLPPPGAPRDRDTLNQQPTAAGGPGDAKGGTP
jgi:hypothetical protein